MSSIKLTEPNECLSQSFENILFTQYFGERFRSEMEFQEPDKGSWRPCGDCDGGWDPSAKRRLIRLLILIMSLSYCGPRPLKSVLGGERVG
jgi:hypothetical protein